MERLNDIQKKARSSWWVDGIPDMVSGVGVFVIGILTILQRTLENAYGTIGGIAYIALFLLTIIAVQYIIRWAKSRWSWPYIGYSMPTRNRKTGYVLLFIGLIALFSIVFFLENPLLESIAMGTFTALILASIGYYSGLRRFYWYGAVGLIASIATGVLFHSEDIIVGTILAIVGIAMFITGMVVFSRFRRFIHEGNIQKDN